MTRDEILETLRDASGNPDTGPVAEILPALADALDATLNPKPRTENETRILTAPETR